MELLEMLALEMGCEYICDLRFLPQPNHALRRIVTNIPLDRFPEQEWLGAAEYLCGAKCSNAEEARKAMMHE